MKAFSAMFLVVFLAVAFCSMPADAKNWPEGRKERPDSKALSYILTPWPFHHICKVCLDSDKDGVPDRLDKCPCTPCGARVDEYGCPIDSDGDGVYDGLDKCPGTPKGALVDKKGCPKDSDGDGVYDGIDRCPNTPSGKKVDERGCPVETSETEKAFLNTGLIRSSNIMFELEKAELKPESEEVIDEIGNILVQWPDLEIEIGGHTDSAGEEGFNQKLSEDRAKAVFEYLVKNFPALDPDNLSVKGYGESKPVASNDTPEGRAKNRRVEFRCLNAEEMQKEIERRKQ